MLILTTSERKPSAVDFVYPFGLLITLTLATNSLDTTKLVSFISFLAAAGVFACWALYAELRDLGASSQSSGVRRALYIQATNTLLAIFTLGVLLLVSPAVFLAQGALINAAVLQVLAAIGTMTGWRFVVSTSD